MQLFAWAGAIIDSVKECCSCCCGCMLSIVERDEYQQHQWQKKKKSNKQHTISFELWTTRRWWILFFFILDNNIAVQKTAHNHISLNVYSSFLFYSFLFLVDGNKNCAVLCVVLYAVALHPCDNEKPNGTDIYTKWTFW